MRKSPLTNLERVKRDTRKHNRWVRTSACLFSGRTTIHFQMCTSAPPAKSIDTGHWNPSSDGVTLSSQCSKPAQQAGAGEEELASWSHQNTGACAQCTATGHSLVTAQTHTSYPCATPTKSINGQVLIDHHFQQTLPFFGCGRKPLSIPIYKMHCHLVCRAVRQDKDF